MKKFLFLVVILISARLHSQVAKSFNYSEGFPIRSGTYIEKHPFEDSYFIAAQRYSSGQSKTTLTKLDNAGNTLWYSSAIQTGTATSFNSLGDLVIYNDSVYISVYDFPTLATATLNIYKFDLDGVLHDSLIIPGTMGLKRFRADMIVNGQGELVTGLKGNDNKVQFCRINPTSMTLVDIQHIVTSSFANTQAERSMFFEYDGTNTTAIFNAQDSVYFAVINSSGSITANDFILSPDGEVTDTERSSGNLILLVNNEFSVSTVAANPVRIITVDNSFNIVSNSTFTGINPLVYSSFTIDSDGSVFVSGRMQNAGSSENPQGALLKIASGSIQYEHGLQYSNLTEIEISNSNIIASGHHRDNVEDCSSDGFGSAIITYKKNTTPTFEVVTTHMNLTVNNINALISYSSNDFINSSTNSAAYSVSGAGTTIYSSSLLLTGENISSQIESSCLSFQNAYAAGPITNQTDYNQIERDKWERVWKISRAQIDAHIQAHQSGDVSYVTPEVILNWPGNGDPAKGQSQTVARFQDLNNNSIYEPLQGEYPLIKGDFCVLSIYNDVNADTANNCISSSNRMNIEVHEYAYGFECAQDSALQNTIFLYYEIIHKSSEVLYNTYVGHFIDHDMQLAVDDFVSSDPVRGIFYARNGDGFGPEQAYLILGSASDEDGLDNAYGIGFGESPNGFGYADGIADNERLGMTNFVYFNGGAAATGDPSSPANFYNYMQSIWLDGQHLLYGGNGYNSGTTAIETNFMYPGDSDNAIWFSTNGIDPGADWSEEIAGNPAGDRRGMASSGPFMYGANDTLYFDVAHVSGMENTTAGYTSHEAMINHVDSVKTFFALDSLPCGQDFDFYAPFDGIYPYIGIAETQNYLPVLFPNPTSGNITITDLPANAQISVYNLAGQRITQVLVKTSSVNFDYSGLPKGIYFVNIQSDSYSGTIKFVKQ